MKHVGIFGLSNNIDEHITQIQNNAQYFLTGIYDNNAIEANKIAQKYGIKCFKHPLDAIGENDIIDFANSHTLDMENAKLAIKCNKNLLLDSTFLKNIERTQELINLNTEAGVDVFISQPDFYNPIIIKALNDISDPTFIEIRRGVNSKSSSGNHLINLLYQEVAIATAFVSGDCKKVNVSSNSMDIDSSNLINARLEFDNAVVVSINISNMVIEEYRNIALFTNDGLVNIDMEKGELKTLTKDAKLSSFEEFGKYNRNNYLEKSFFAFEHLDKEKYKVFNLYDASKVLHILDIIEDKLYSYAM